MRCMTRSDSKHKHRFARRDNRLCFWAERFLVEAYF
jgi:hypothetical protein